MGYPVYRPVIYGRDSACIGKARTAREARDVLYDHLYEKHGKAVRDGRSGTAVRVASIDAENAERVRVDGAGVALIVGEATFDAHDKIWIAF